MKIFKFIIPVLLIIFSACSSNDQYKVEGTVKNAEGKKLYFEKLGLNTAYPIDSVKLNKKGTFEFKGDELNQPTFFLLRLENSGVITLLVDSTENVRITADANNFATGYKVENSLGSAYIQVLNDKLAKLKKTVNDYIKEYNNTPANDTEKRKEIVNKINTAVQQHKEFIGEFVMDHPRSFASYYALFQRWDDNTLVMNIMDKKDQVYYSTIATSLNLLYPESERVKHLYNYVLRVKLGQRNERKINDILKDAKVNNFPDIVEKDINGKEVKLSSLKGKVIILSFWASWDKKSREASKSLKSVYKKYHKRGLEIYQVSLDRSKVLWENAVKVDELPWINVSDLRYTESLAAKQYNVKRIPTNFIIDRKGDIVGKDLYGQRLEEKMRELFK